MPANPSAGGASHSTVRRIVLPVSVAVLTACTLALTQVGLGATPPVPDAPIAGNTTGYLSECAALPDSRKARCYVRGLLREVDRSDNPATGVPAIDAKVHDIGGFLEAACHSLMHEVGRTWAKQHDLTLEDLQRYVPHSNDPGCSAGFGMGLSYSQFAIIVLRDAPRDGQGAVTAAVSLSDALGTALGTGIAGAILAAFVRAGAGPAPALGVTMP